MDQVESYPWVMGLVEEYLEESQADEVKMFQVLEYGMKKEQRIRSQFEKLIEITGDQNITDQGPSDRNVKDLYLRPKSQRQSFSLKAYPHYLPFSIYCYMRSHYLQKLEGKSEFETMQYIQGVMFRFEDDFVINHVNVLNKWDLVYVLFNPITSFAVKTFFQQMFGQENDYIPIMHPRSFPTIMFMDYKNLLGFGNTALYMSSPKKHYYLKVGDSLEGYFEKHIGYLEKGYFERENGNRISALYNIDKIYEEFIKKPHDMALYKEINAKFPMLSCSVKHGIQVSIQAKFEPIQSTIVPATEEARKLNIFPQYFFVLKIKIKFVGNGDAWPKEQYKLGDMTLDLEYKDHFDKDAKQTITVGDYWSMQSRPSDDGIPYDELQMEHASKEWKIGGKLPAPTDPNSHVYETFQLLYMPRMGVKARGEVTFKKISKIAPGDGKIGSKAGDLMVEVDDVKDEEEDMEENEKDLNQDEG